MIASLHTTDLSPLDIRHFGKAFGGGDLVFGYIDGRDWVVPNDFSYQMLDGRVTTVREGFVTDFASVPRMFWRLLPPAGLRNNPYGLAALWHDWLYDHKAVGGFPITREQADNVLYEIMSYIGVRNSIIQTIYRSVRVGGWVRWKFGRNRTQET